MTDDYFVEFYQNGRLVNFKKSKYTFSSTGVEILTKSTNDILINNSYLNVDNLYYSYVDGEWHLIEKRLTAHEGDICECQHEVSYYDWTAHANDNAVVS